MILNRLLIRCRHPAFWRAWKPKSIFLAASMERVFFPRHLMVPSHVFTNFKSTNLQKKITKYSFNQFIYLVQLIQTTNTNPEYLQQNFCLFTFWVFWQAKSSQFRSKYTKKANRTGYTKNIKNTLQHLKYWKSK